MSFEDASNTRAVSIFITYLSTNLCLFLLIVTSISDFSRHPSRKSTSSILLFNLLQGVSLAVTWYYMFSFFGLSYRSWAFDHSVSLPARPSPARVSEISDAWASIKLGAWLKDVKLFRDAWETVVETPARTCWSLPIFFITTGWSLFIAKEAPRRGIRYSWAYMLLGQLVAISFAMNLFFLAVILHPVQSVASSGDAAATPKALDPPDSCELSVPQQKPPFWAPLSFIYWVILGLTFASIGVTCVSAGEPHFLLLLAVPHVLLILPPILPSILPSKLGQVLSSDSTYSAYFDRKVAATVLLGIGFEVVALYTALSTALPALRHTHRHSNVYSYPWQDALEWGSESPGQNLWRSLWDHPAVSSVGWDSILCTASFTTWILVS